MFVGASGVARVVERTAQLMRDHDTEDVAPHVRNPHRRVSELIQLGRRLAHFRRVVEAQMGTPYASSGDFLHVGNVP